MLTTFDKYFVGKDDECMNAQCTISTYSLAIVHLIFSAFRSTVVYAKEQSTFDNTVTCDVCVSFIPVRSS
jgi:hypothetical protein